MLRRILPLTILVTLFCFPIRAEKPVPDFSLQQYVLDQTNTLCHQEKQSLKSTLEKLENTTGKKVRILIVPSTQPETIKEYGKRVADSFRGVINKNHILLIVEKREQKAFMYVHNGLRNLVSERVSDKIIQEKVNPRLRKEAFYEGVKSGIDVLESHLRGENLYKVYKNHSGNKGKSSAGAIAAMVFLPVLIGFEYLRFKVGRFSGRLAGLALVIGVLYFMQSLMFALVYGTVLLIISFLLQLVPAGNIKEMTGGGFMGISSGGDFRGGPGKDGFHRW